MKKVLLLLFASVWCCLFKGYAQNEVTMKHFEWLEGSWEGKWQRGVIRENWRKLNDQTLIGEGAYLIGKDTAIYEKLRFQFIDGHWCFIATIRDSLPVLFTLHEFTAKKWIFENQEHSYPQRLAYVKQDNGLLLSWIEGVKEGQLKRETYRLKKIDP